MKSPKLLRLLPGCLAFLLLGATPVADGWQSVGTRDGVHVSVRPVEGRTIPEFRSVGEVPGSLYEVLAIIHDVDKHPQWQPQCVGAKLLKQEGKMVGWVYNRTTWPWPVADRDAVVRTETMIVKPGEEIRIPFQAAPPEVLPVQRGAVRMNRLDGEYHLTALAPDRTLVDYRVDADPGGRIPAWMTVRFTQTLPLETLLNLRRQLVSTRGQYEEFIADWKPE